MKIHVVIPKSFAGCGFYRQYQPHNRLAKVEGVSVTFSAGLEDFNDNFSVDADILQCHKGYIPEERLLAECRKRGIITIGDFDDYWSVDTEHVLYSSYKKHNTEQQLLDFLMGVDYVTCSTERLAEKIRRHRDGVAVLPNAMDMNYPGCAVGRVPEPSIVFGYVGGSCHVKDVEQLRGLNNRVSHIKGYRFRLFGFDNTPVYKGYAEILSDSGRLAITHFDWVQRANIWDYPKFYNYMDVSLVPLVGNEFNSMKSELKLIEAGFFKKGVIVSNVEPYRGLLRHKENCFVVNKPRDWARGVEWYMEDPGRIAATGEELYKTVQPFQIDRVNKKRLKFYRDVLKERNSDGGKRHSRVSDLVEQ